ncbi:helix-turn-helix domain-containing protein [Paenalcaligenes suwonensis]|nr:helix-turn-helix domain-containing protein [Paenalcaligenes suwonensis]NHC60109.1 helix-turn-helix domain-containing protein [Paenalcaligenes suwonensis]
MSLDFPSLETINRPAVDTATAAYYLNRKPQTLRVWACLENGPIKPIRVNGRLAWRVADIKAVMEV